MHTAQVHSACLAEVPLEQPNNLKHKLSEYQRQNTNKAAVVYTELHDIKAVTVQHSPSCGTLRCH